MLLWSSENVRVSSRGLAEATSALGAMLPAVSLPGLPPALLLQAGAATAAAAEALAAQKAAYAQQAAQLEVQRRALQAHEQAHEQAARKAEAERAQVCSGSCPALLKIVSCFVATEALSGTRRRCLRAF